MKQLRKTFSFAAVILFMVAMIVPQSAWAQNDSESVIVPFGVTVVGASDEGAEKLFDGVYYGDKWCTNFDSNKISYVTVDASKSIILKSLVFFKADDSKEYPNRNWKVCYISGTNDLKDNEWDPIVGLDFNEDIDGTDSWGGMHFNIPDNKDAYRYYKIEIEDVEGKETDESFKQQMAEIELYGAFPNGEEPVYLVSNSILLNQPFNGDASERKSVNIVVTSDFTVKNGTINIKNKDVTIDLNGHTLSMNGLFSLSNGSCVTVKNGTIAQTEEKESTIFWIGDEESSLTVLSGKYSSYEKAIINKGNLTLQGGRFSTSSYINPAIDNSGTITLGENCVLLDGDGNAIEDLSNLGSYKMIRVAKSGEDYVDTEKYGNPFNVRVITTDIDDDYNDVYTTPHGEEADKMFDGNKNTKWCCASDEDCKNFYVIVKADYPTMLKGCMLTEGEDTYNYPNRDWDSWKISGANDSSDQNWVTIKEGNGGVHKSDHKTDTEEPCCKFFDFSDNDKIYQYYRIDINVKDGEEEYDPEENEWDFLYYITQMAEMKLYGDAYCTEGHTYDKHQLLEDESEKVDDLYPVICDICGTVSEDEVSSKELDFVLTWTGYKYTAGDVTLTDGSAFNSPVEFTAEKITYNRTMGSGTTNQWGTLCLPFALTVDAATQPYDFYTLTSATSTEITMTKVPNGTLPAGTPVLVRRNTGETGISLVEENVKVNASTVPGEEQSGLQMKGTLTGEDVTSGYYLSSTDNKLYSISAYCSENSVGSLRIPPFRAWFDGTVPSSAKALGINFEEDGTLTSLSAVSALIDGKAEIYDLNGRRLNDLQNGVNIMKYGNGKSVKVIKR